MSVPKPPIISIPADPRNINVRPAGLHWEFQVIHTTAGGRTIADLGRWFGGENLRQGLSGSTQRGIDLDGNIGEFVRLDQQPIAHGQESGATAKVLIGNEGISANAIGIGYEHLDGGVPGQVTPKQLEASAWIMAWDWQEQIAPFAHLTGAVLDMGHLIQHKHLAPSSRPFCASWPDTRVREHLERIKARLAGVVVPPVDPRDERIVQLKAALAITASAIDAEALAAANSATRLRSASQGARDALQRWG